jgi:hypothetical protein
MILYDILLVSCPHQYCHEFVLVNPLRGRDRMVVGFTTAYAISSYHH